MHYKQCIYDSLIFFLPVHCSSPLFLVFDSLGARSYTGTQLHYSTDRHECTQT